VHAEARDPRHHVGEVHLVVFAQLLEPAVPDEVAKHRVHVLCRDGRPLGGRHLADDAENGRASHLEVEVGGTAVDLLAEE